MVHLSQAKVRYLAPDKLKLAKKKFEFMLEQGIFRPSNSQWASPLHLVRKKTGDWRPCVGLSSFECRNTT
ncbi:hypothetical protein TNCV_509581 [Trichonephila clavipes]|nr:hypothetical protein TNCV_509581 [Trichonephila clavipes]